MVNHIQKWRDIMAYINAEEVRIVRENLKKKFPEFKFSVRKRDNMVLCVSILKGPVRFDEKDYAQINHYHTDFYQNEKILKQIIQVCNEKNFDNSDIQSDYFSVGFYFNIEQGKWDKPYVLTKD
jgi:hypothetical protein